MNKKKTGLFKPEDIDFDTKILDFIIAIADEGGLSKAAEALYLSQPALSRYLKAVETSLGTPIFFRRHQGLALTPAGKVFINGARSMVHLEQETLRKIQSEKQNRDTSVRISVQSFLIPFFQAEISPAFSSAFPHFAVYTQEGNDRTIREQTSNGSIDLGFFLGEPCETPYFFQKSLLDSELVFIAASKSPGLKRCRNSGFQLSFFAGEPVMAHLEDTFLSRKQNQIFTENSINQPDRCARGTIKVLTDLVKLGYGNVILPSKAADLPRDRTFSLNPPQSCSCIAAWCRGRPLSVPAEEYLKTAELKFKNEFFA